MRLLVWFIVLNAIADVCAAPGQAALRQAGIGKFEGRSAAGVAVEVGARKTGSLDLRTCDASLSWGKEKLNVAAAVPQIDLDVFEGEIAGQGPTAAFATQSSDKPCCPTYQIYSLEKPPRLLRTITGGGFYRARDSDLDGRIEVWTDDVAALDGFEGLAASEFPIMPMLVLRFAGGRLLDVSAEFQPNFDRIIGALKAQIDASRRSAAAER